MRKLYAEILAHRCTPTEWNTGLELFNILLSFEGLESFALLGKLPILFSDPSATPTVSRLDQYQPAGHTPGLLLQHGQLLTLHDVPPLPVAGAAAVGAMLLPEAPQPHFARFQQPCLALQRVCATKHICANSNPTLCYLTASRMLSA